ncbi:MAG: hypothetical protein RL748_4428 [Pseudomonadota bacterium]
MSDILFNLVHAGELKQFCDGVMAQAPAGARFDSASAATESLGALTGGSNIKTPLILDTLLGNVSAGREQATLKAFYDGVTMYQKEHGRPPSSDLFLTAAHQAQYLFDSASNAHHDQISIQPGLPQVAIMSPFALACPFAGYLPAGYTSNECRIVVLDHVAGSDWGDYRVGSSLDGINGGKSYLSAARQMALLAPNEAKIYQFTFRRATGDAASPPVSLLRGRTVVFVGGRRAITEVSNGQSNAANVPINGIVRLNGTDYTLTGIIKPASGEVTITPNPALPQNTQVLVNAFIDYESENDSPEIAVRTSTFSVFASPFRMSYSATPEARSQLALELGIDANSEASLVMRGQYAMERHYEALKLCLILASGNTLTYDCAFSQQYQQKTRAQIWQDFATPLNLVGQRMAEETGDHGITHLYVGKLIRAQLMSLPPELFIPSGLTERASIYRIGRLNGRYEVYYTPRHLAEADDGSSAEVLCIGRSDQVARNPIIFGDASPLMVEPLGVTKNAKSGNVGNARSITSDNPHPPSASGCALITVININMKGQ